MWFGNKGIWNLWWVSYKSFDELSGFRKGYIFFEFHFEDWLFNFPLRAISYMLPHGDAFLSCFSCWNQCMWRSVRDILCQWVKDAMTAAGIDTSFLKVVIICHTSGPFQTNILIGECISLHHTPYYPASIVTLAHQLWSAPSQLTADVAPPLAFVDCVALVDSGR